MRAGEQEKRATRRRRCVRGALVAALVLAAGLAPAGAEVTTPACLARKLKEWGKLRECQAAEKGRALLAQQADPAKCQARFDARLASLTALASAAGVACRYEVNGDGTVTDYDTGLQWEQKTDDRSVHDRANEYDWSPTLGRPDGTAFTTFLGTLNDETSEDGATTDGCFAGHCDWRLPSIVELQTIVDLTAAGCGSGSACIDQGVFGPTLAFFYWSATSETGLQVFAWGVAFGADGSATVAIKEAPLFARAVRSRL